MGEEEAEVEIEEVVTVEEEVEMNMVKDKASEELQERDQMASHKLKPGETKPDLMPPEMKLLHLEDQEEIDTLAMKVDNMEDSIREMELVEPEEVAKLDQNSARETQSIDNTKERDKKLLVPEK